MTYKTHSTSRILFIILFAIAIGFSQQSYAEQTGESLVQQYRCYPCHDNAKLLIGPSYNLISARHKDNAEFMINVLAEKVIVGGAGNWGVVPMVPNESVSPEEARTMVRWILEQN